MKSKLNKKILISAFASVLAGAAIVVPNININNAQKSGHVSDVAKNAAISIDTCLAPNANDLYNDYSYNQGFVSVVSNNVSVINFYDWLGIKLWSFDVNANSNYLFGFAATVQTLKVKSSSDGLQMYVYGTLTSNKSYIFKLNVADGSVVQVSNNKVSFVSDGKSTGLILNGNLLSFSNEYLILTSKTPDLDGSSVYVSFSEINLLTGSVTNRTFNISPSAKGQNVYSWGEIVSVQKVDSYYSFAVKYDLYKNGGHRPALLVTCLDAQLNSAYAGKFLKTKSFSFLNSHADAIDNWQANPINLDTVVINVKKINDTKTVQQNLFYMEYSTINMDKYPSYGSTIFGTCGIDSKGNTSIATYDIAQASIDGTPISNTAAIKSANSSSNSTADISGIVGYFENQATGITYLAVANSDLTKIGFLPIEGTILYGDPAGGNDPWWVDISGFASTKYQAINFDFFPNNSGNNNNYYGYVWISQKNDKGNMTTKQSIFALNSDKQTFAIINGMDFSYAFTDDQIKAKYNGANYLANENTEKLIVADLTSITKNGSPYLAVKLVANNLSVDATKNTIKGFITFSVDNYWNSNQSQLTRYVDLQLNPTTVTKTDIKNVSTPSSSNNNSSANVNSEFNPNIQNKDLSNNDSSTSAKSEFNPNIQNKGSSNNDSSISVNNSRNLSNSSNVVVYSVIALLTLVVIAMVLVAIKTLKNKRKI